MRPSSPHSLRAIQRVYGCAVGRRRGMALLLVLITLLLVSALVLAFFSSTKSEVSSTAAFAATGESSALADSAVNLVISQIRDGTNHGNGNTTWASQPGLIRNYDTSGNESAFKLYSASVMRPPAGSFNPVGNLTTEIPNGWASLPAEFVDLNTPLQCPDGHFEYPILAPGTLAAAGNSTEVDGFGITDASFIATNSSTNCTEIKMPVRWLYVKRDGTMAPLLDGKVAGADRDTNPIVGRVAFWTDDETCKLNINTASHGVFHGTPYADSGALSGTPAIYTERRLGWSMPVANEFSRFPGHPAMTSLSPVLKSLWNPDSYDFSNAQYSSVIKPYYDISPKTGSGGSQGGSVHTTGATPFSPPNATAGTARLYATPDELAFDPSRAANAGAITPDFVSARRFFLTATSRSPEVTLFGTPRIALWPLQNVNDPNFPGKTRNTKDRLLAFCSTLNSKPYYFERNTVTAAAAAPASSTSLDFNLGTWSSMLPDCFDPEAGLATGTRNAAIYSYLQNLTTKTVPGFSSSFATKYGTQNRDQLLTQMVDFLRSNINIQSANNMDFVYRYVADAPTAGGPSDGGALKNQVTPLKPSAGPAVGTKGLGCFSNVTGALMTFYTENATITGNATAPTVTPTTMRVFFVFESNNPLATMPGVGWSARLRVTGLQNLSVTPAGGTIATNLFPPSVDACLYYSRAGANANGPSWMGGQFSPLRGNSLAAVTSVRVPGTNPLTQFTLCSADIPLPAGITSNSTFDFSGGTIQVEVYSALAPQRPLQDTLVQTVNIHLPAGTGWPVPLPILNTSGVIYNFSRRTTDREGASWSTWWQKFLYKGESLNASKQLNAGNYGYMTYDGIDTTRMVTLNPSAPTVDYRVLASQSSVSVASNAFSALESPYNSYAGGGNSTRTNYAFWEGGGTNGNNAYRVNRGGSGIPSPLLLASGTSLVTWGGITASTVAPFMLLGSGATLSGGAPGLGDWEGGVGNLGDNTLGGRLDRGSTGVDGAGYFLSSSDSLPVFFDNAGYSPNRQISSAVSFGGLLTHSAASPRPWETLLFCPNPAAGSSHPGFSNPPDHLWLDLFNMPIVEPYAISEPLSTAGKVNMNYQLAPFTYIKRSCAMRGVFKGTWLTAIGSGEANASRYKRNVKDSTTPNGNTAIYRYGINADETLQGFDTVFAGGRIFRSATQICEQFLVPQALPGSSNSGSTQAGVATWWDNYRQTGDNVREEPYGHLYSRLTTQSNTYTVHVRAQSVTLPPGVNYGSIDPAKIMVTSEYRGSSLIERYIDPADPRLAADSYDAATGTTSSTVATLDKYYKFRIVNSSEFAP